MPKPNRRVGKKMPPPEPITAEQMEHIKKTAYHAWLPTHRLFRAPYQRTPTPEALALLVKDGFHLEALATILVSDRGNGTWAILDGGHRHKLAEMYAVAEMLCQVYTGLSYGQESTLHGLIVNARAQTAKDRFRTSFQQGDPRTVMINTIVNSHGLHVATDDNFIGGVHAISALQSIMVDLGPQGLDDILGMLVAAWGVTDASKQAWSTGLLDGMRQFWGRYRQEASPSRMVTALQKVTPSQILIEAAGVHKQGQNTSSLVARFLVYKYNHQLRTNRLDDWMDVRKGATSRVIVGRQPRSLDEGGDSMAAAPGD